jgi:MFS family permease
MAHFAIKPSRAFIGAAIGAGLFVVLGLLVDTLWPLLLVYAAVVLLGYIVGAATVGTSAGEFFRGLLIGTSAAVNFAVASVVFPEVFGPDAGVVLAIVVAAIAFLSTFGVVSRNALYQGLLGYLNWLLPLSWPIVALGFTFFLLCLLGALVLGLFGVTFFKIERLVFEWKTGTLFTRGGWISNLNPIDTAFNMGNFAFVDVAFSDMAIDHEAGHTLNLAAFGSLFHLIGAFDENVLRGASAFSECLAESHVPGSSEPVLSMWT